MRKPILVLFDGNAIVHRAFHAFQNTKPLTSKTGEIVSAVFGFGSMLLKATTELKPTYYAIAFDKAAPTFRHQMFEEYKAQRPPMPDELANQLGRVRQLVEAFQLPIFEIDGFEADDVLGTLSRQAAGKDLDTVIVTGDADAMQLVEPKVKVLYPKPRGSFSDTTLYDEKGVVERYGVPPKNIVDLKALVGDPSDNIPGVRGIGDKTAVRLIQQFGAIEEVYKHLDEVEPPRVRDILREGEATARQSKKLATIVTDVAITLDLEQCRISRYDRDKVAELFRELGFASLLPKLNELEEAIASVTPRVPVRPTPPHDYRTVSTSEALGEMVKRLSSVPAIAIDLEATGLDPMQAQIVGLSFSPAVGEAYYVPVGHIAWGDVQQLPLDAVRAGLKPLLESISVAKVAHNANYDTMLLAENGLSVNNLTSDTMVAAYLLSEKSLSLKSLAFERLGVEMANITILIGTGAKQLSMSQVPIDKVAEYAAADADMTFQLAGILEPELKAQGLWLLFADVEMPLVPVLVKMQRVGVLLDTDRLRQMSFRLGEQMRKSELDVYNAVGHQFNINSPQQLSTVLFKELNLPGRRKGGAYTTGAEVLEELRGVHPVIDPILEYRQLGKLKSTYIDALPAMINPRTGRVHTSFNQTKTATGRLSSSDPNLQNIPIRSSLGREIREAFIAPPGHVLVSADYSQIDLRALAHLSQDASLLEAFHHDEDIHTATASRLYNVPVDAVTGEMRRLAKTVNFGVIYGMSEYGLEQRTDLSREESAKFIEAYFERYPGVTRYLEDTKKHAREKGYVQTILGRRRLIPEVNSANRQVRQAAERMAINMPVQGTSADIIKVAMINLDREMDKRGLKSRMLLQVHDELVFEVPDAELAEMRELAPRIMSTAIELSVPVKVDVRTGQNWGELK